MPSTCVVFFVIAMHTLKERTTILIKDAINSLKSLNLGKDCSRIARRKHVPMPPARGVAERGGC